MKSVLISIRPEWCEKIASGEKTIEVRKTKPRCKKPFKCYIYCTKPKERLSLNGGLFCFEDDLAILNRLGMPRIGNPWGSLDKGEMLINGMVIGEFICDRISEAHWMQDLGYACVYKTWQDNEDCMTNDELLEYMGEKDILYGWHISDLKIYEDPKELREFHKHCTPECNFSEECGGTTKRNCLFPLSRPPQSWCYVEEAENE